MGPALPLEPSAVLDRCNGEHSIAIRRALLSPLRQRMIRRPQRTAVTGPVWDRAGSTKKGQTQGERDEALHPGHAELLRKSAPNVARRGYRSHVQRSLTTISLASAPRRSRGPGRRFQLWFQTRKG